MYYTQNTKYAVQRKSFLPRHAIARDGIARVWCPSVCPSVWCDVDVCWSYKLGYLEFYHTIN